MRRIAGLAILAVALWAVSPASAFAQDEPAGEEEAVEEGESEESSSASSPSSLNIEEEVLENEDESGGEPDKEGVVILKKSGGKKKVPAYTVIGATPLDREDTIVRVAVGYPEVQVVYHMPWDHNLEVAVGGGLFYGYNAQTAGDVTGFSGLAEGRWRFWQDGEHSIALTAAPALMIQVDPVFALGLVVGGPGLTYDYEINGEHHAVLGVQIPWGVFFSEAGAAARIPLVFKMGMEFELSRQMHVFVTNEVGADVWSGEGYDGAYLYVRALAGAGFAL